MTKPLPQAFADRLERVGGGRRVARAELQDLAEYHGTLVEWVNELDVKMADFAANVEMLLGGRYQGREERARLREAVTGDAAAAAAALREIAFLAGPPPGGSRAAGRSRQPRRPDGRFAAARPAALQAKGITSGRRLRA